MCKKITMTSTEGILLMYRRAPEEIRDLTDSCVNLTLAARRCKELPLDSDLAKAAKAITLSAIAKHSVNKVEVDTLEQAYCPPDLEFYRDLILEQAGGIL